MSAPKTLNGKIVLQAYMLDNSYKTLLVEPTSTVHVRFYTAARRAAFAASRALSTIIVFRRARPLTTTPCKTPRRTCAA